MELEKISVRKILQYEGGERMINQELDLKEKLKEKLRELFQFESEDLDFGIYRIMNYKRKEIEKFIEKELINEIKRQLELVGEDEQKKLEEKLKDISSKNGVKKYLDALEKGDEERVKIYKEDFAKDIEEYEKLKRQLEEIKISEDLEKEIYNHLINFFSRYYEQGDFISKRRYGKAEKYVVPYNGEEVLLHWANKDQYYIKTTEYFRKYTFKTTQGLKVNFRVVEAEEEKGNIKSQEKKFFVLNEKIFDFDKEKNELNIYFEYRGLTEKEEEKYKQGNSASQDKINEETISTLQKEIPQNSIARLIFEKDGEKTLIEKHLYRYTRRNTTDYFIHKDLKRFLERELDFYIKNEFLQLEDLQVLEQSGYFDKLRLYLIGVRTFRNIALKIIEFLAQIENFQKKLWEKKKFVIDTHYVITLDKIAQYAGEDFLLSIIDEILDNEKQLEEWKELLGIEVKGKEDLFTTDETATKGLFDNTTPKMEFKKLPIDTKYFDEEFKWKLITALSKNNDIDEILDGILIKSENFQGLNLLLNKYIEKVQTIYIDPPFNTGEDFLYKDGFRNSTWLSLIKDRIDFVKLFLKREGAFYLHLDENANYYGRILLQNLQFENIQEIVFNTNATKDEEADLFGYKSFGNRFVLKHNTIFYCFNSDSYFIKLWKPNRNTTKLKIGWLDLISKPKVDSPKKIEDFDFFIEKYDDTGELKLVKINVNEKIFPLGDLWTDIYSFTQSEMRTSENISFLTQKPENLIRRILQTSSKQGDLIMDYFAGSGTTLVVAHKLRRKWIGVEMGDVFNEFYKDIEKKSTVKKLGILGRLKIVLNGDKKFIAVDKERRSHLSEDINWQAGGFFKYHTLEQYEDALENIEFEQQDEEQMKILYELPDYFVKYMLEWETKQSSTFLNLEKLKNPFSYKLKIIENYEQKQVNVDIIETFNYLLGIKVKAYKTLNENGRKYVFVLGEKENRKIAIIWRSMEEIDLEKDKEIIKETLKEFNPDEIYINGDAIVENFKAIEPLFKSLMFEEMR